MLVMLFFFLSLVLVGHANPLPTDIDHLPVAPDSMELQICTEDTRLANCFHPVFGLVYGGIPGKPIHHATWGNHDDLETGQTINHAATLSKRGGWNLDCTSEMTYNHCQMSPRRYHCDGGDFPKYDQYEMACTKTCKCYTLQTCIVEDGKCIPVIVTGPTLPPRNVVATATAVHESAPTNNPSSMSNDNALETELIALSKRDDQLDNQMGGWYMDCHQIAFTRWCYEHPRNFFCDENGNLVWSYYEDACSTCNCIAIVPIYPPIVPVCRGWGRPGGCRIGAAAEALEAVEDAKSNNTAINKPAPTDDPSVTSNVNSLETGLVALSERDKQLEGWYLDCHQIRFTQWCYDHPRNYFCDRDGNLQWSEFSLPCMSCECVWLGYIDPPVKRLLHELENHSAGSAVEPAKSIDTAIVDDTVAISANTANAIPNEEDTSFNEEDATLDEEDATTDEVDVILNEEDAIPDKEDATALKEDATPDTELITLAKREGQLNGWIMDCHGIRATQFCYDAPRNFFCNGYGVLAYSAYEDSCSYCDCIRYGSVQIVPPCGWKCGADATPGADINANVAAVDEGTAVSSDKEDDVATAVK